MLATSSRLDRLVPWAAGLVLAIPVLAVRFPPMLDLPLHEAVVGLWRHWGDPTFTPPGVYSLNLGQPSQAFYFAIFALSYVVPLPAATRLVVAMTLLCLPLAAARLADHLGVTRWTALLVAPLGLGWMFFYGLLANLMGLVAYLFALPSFDRFVDRPGARGFVTVSVWLVLLHYVHDLMALAAGLTLFVLTLCAWRPDGWWRNVLRLGPAGLAVGVAVVSRLLETHVVQTGGRDIVTFSPLRFRVVTFADWLFTGTGVVSLALLALASIPLALFLAEPARKREPGGPLAPFGWRFRFEIVAGAFLLVYLLAPISIELTKSAWAAGQIHLRFLALAWSVLVVARGPAEMASRRMRLAKGIACIVPIAPILVAWPEFAASDRAYRALDVIAEHMDKGSALALFELGPIAPGALFRASSGGGYLVAKLGGRSLFDFSRSPAAPVVQRTDAPWAEPFDRTEFSPFHLIPPHDLRRFRYVVLHSSDPGLLTIAAMAMAPEARVAYHEGDYTLLESTLPLVPIDAPDDPFPPPHPPDLGDRIQRLAQSLN